MEVGSIWEIVMEQLKMFSGLLFPDNKPEKEMNEWLAKNPNIKITRVIQNSSASKESMAQFILTTIFYEPRP